MKHAIIGRSLCKLEHLHRLFAVLLNAKSRGVAGGKLADGIKRALLGSHSVPTDRLIVVLQDAASLEKAIAKTRASLCISQRGCFGKRVLFYNPYRIFIKI